MNRFVNLLIKRFIRDDKKVLGRWSIEHCDKKTNNRVDLSNEDHCGPCGQYMLDKTSLLCDSKRVAAENLQSRSDVGNRLNKLPMALARGASQTKS